MRRHRGEQARKQFSGESQTRVQKQSKLPPERSRQQAGGQSRSHTRPQCGTRSSASNLPLRSVMPLALTAAFLPSILRDTLPSCCLPSTLRGAPCPVLCSLRHGVSRSALCCDTTARRGALLRCWSGGARCPRSACAPACVTPEPHSPQASQQLATQLHVHCSRPEFPLVDVEAPSAQ